MDQLIAYCGLNCEKCDARIATLNDDNALREKTAKLWSELNQIEITAEMIQCTGCRTDGVKTYYCSDMCEIRKCAINKGLASCGDCEELKKCPILAMIVSNNSEAMNNLKK